METKSMLEDLIEAKKKIDALKPMINTICIITKSRAWFEDQTRQIMVKAPDAKYKVTQGMLEANGIKVIHVTSVNQVRGLRNWEVLLLDDAHEVEDFEEIMCELEYDRAIRADRGSRGAQ